MTAVDWAALVAQVRAGDPVAGPVLVSSLAGRLDRYAETIAHDLPQVEREAAVEAALAKVVSKIDRYDETKGTLPTWARAFVRHETNERRRGFTEHSTDPAVLADYLSGTSAGTNPTADAAIAAVDGDPYDPDVALDPKYVAVTALLLQLDPGDAALVVAHVQEQLTFPQIAEQLGPPATADALRQRFRRARKGVLAAARLDPDLKPLTEEMTP